MKEEEVIAARRFVRAFVDRDQETLDSADEDNSRVVAPAIAACFAATVRARIPAADVANVAAGTLLLDSEGKKIPTWVVEATFRGFLDDPGMLQGITPELLIDTQLAYIEAADPDVSADERDRVFAAACAILDELRDVTPDA